MKTIETQEQTSAMPKKINTTTGQIIFVLNGKLHNYDGPAYYPNVTEKENGAKPSYHLFGFEYTKDEWKVRRKDGKVQDSQKVKPEEVNREND